MGHTVYFKCERCVEVQSDAVYLQDLGSLYCDNTKIASGLKQMRITEFRADDENRKVVGSVYLIARMKEKYPDIEVEMLGEQDVLIERIRVPKRKGWKQWWKIVFVCLVSFFGTAFTIMAYHNDAGVGEIFAEVYRLIMNREPEGVTIMEIAYSLGLAIGITVFFNHIGGRRITKDPTPIEVAMRNYEYDVDMALIELADREGRELDV